MTAVERLFQCLLIFVPLTLFFRFLHVSPFITFFLASLAIIPLAKYVGQATEELAKHSGSALGGFLNATFGNITEFVIALFAIRAGLLEVVKASITGSIIGNLLLVQGMAIFVGGCKYKSQKFNRTMAMASGSMLLLAVTGLMIPALFYQTAPEVGSKIIEELSIMVAIFMILAYIANLLFSLHTHKELYLDAQESHAPHWNRMKSITVLLFATAAVALMSEILVGSIEPLVAQFGWTELFIGVIFVAIIGNAAEHASAVTVALKDKMNLSLQISIGSATQIAMFVAPLLVLVSLAFQKPMSLIFNIFELISIFLSVLVVNFIIEDGESNWLEGVQLLGAYAIMAVAFFFHP